MKYPVSLGLARPLTAALLLPLVTAAASWNQWRGPDRDGVAAGFKSPARWTAQSLVKTWTVNVGEGHSSPVLSGDRAYIFARENEREIMRCLSLSDGKVLWQQAYDAPYEMNPAARGHGKGPKSTPAVVDGRVFSLGINGHLSAYDAKSGAMLWRQEFGRTFKETAPLYGAAMSPLVDGDKVIVHVGGEDSGALMAFDVRSGAAKWKWDGDGPAYTSPIIAPVGGIRQLITQSQNHCVAVSPDDGRLLWKVPFKTPYDQNIITPVVAGDLAIFGGIQKPTFALRIGGKEPVPAWETREITMYMSSPVLDGTMLYGMSDRQRGMLFSLNTATGAVLWKSEGRLGANASLTDIGPALLVVTEPGELMIMEKATGGSLKEVFKTKVADTPVWASPAVGNKQILIKDRSTLMLYTIAGQ